MLRLTVYLGKWARAGCRNREEIKCQNLIEAAGKIKMICGCFCYLEIQMKRRLRQTQGRGARSNSSKREPMEIVTGNPKQMRLF